MALDLNALLEPISPDQPTGQWLRATDEGKVLWNTINDAYRTARDAEKILLRPPDPDAPKEARAADLPSKIDKSWGTVLTQGEKALSKVSKDLTVATWMVEALFRVDELDGLRDGLSLCRQLCERYWPALYPPVDELDVDDGIHTTVTQLAGLGIALEMPLKLMVITDSGRTVADWLRAGHLDTGDPAAKQKAVSEGAATLDVLTAEGAKTPVQTHEKRLKALEEALEELDGLKTFLTANCFVEKASGEDEKKEKVWLVPNLIPLVELLEQVRSAVKWVRGTGTEGGTTPPDGSVQQPAGTAVAGGPGLPAVDIRSREAAYAQLLQIADFLERAEPHSPVPPMLRQAVRFGRMNLSDLLIELLGRSDALKTVSLRTGIKIPEEG